jgi:hypothetical protein
MTDPSGRGRATIDIRGAHLHIDGASGAAGDMFLGAAIDLGVPAGVVRDALTALGAELDLRADKIVRGGIASIDVGILAGGQKIVEPHSHDHDHGHDHGRAYADIHAQISAAGLADPIKARALDIFDRIARAEAMLHGTDLERVHFHELGALDALGDIVGAAAALEWLRPASITAAPIAVGGGLTRSAHGKLPVPAPATLEVLREVGAPIIAGGSSFELCTPTGAAILASAVTAWTGPRGLAPIAIGYGAGDRELEDRPNVLRITALRAAGGAADRVVLLETNIDDLSPEIAAHAAAAMEAAGALDVWWTPITMKKSRPAWVLAALVRAAEADAVERAMFAETSTIGVRRSEVDRRIADREIVAVDTRFGPAEIKVARIGGEVVNAAPEFESCAALARAAKVPLIQVYNATLAAWSARDPDSESTE